MSSFRPSPTCKSRCSIRILVYAIKICRKSPMLTCEMPCHYDEAVHRAVSFMIVTTAMERPPRRTALLALKAIHLASSWESGARAGVPAGTLWFGDGP